MQPQDPYQQSPAGTPYNPYSGQPNQPVQPQPAQPAQPQPAYQPQPMQYPEDITAASFEQLAENSLQQTAAQPPEPANIPPYQQPQDPAATAMPYAAMPTQVPPAELSQSTQTAYEPQYPPYQPAAEPNAQPMYQQAQSPAYSANPPTIDEARGAENSESVSDSADKKGRKKAKKEFRNPLETMRPGERIICSIKRHPIGIMPVYAGAAVALIILAILGFALGPSMLSNYSHTQVYAIVSLFLLGAVALTGLFVSVAHTVYWGNRWIVTDDSVTQVLQNSLFDKKSSQLSMANLEDVTVEQDGFLPHMFDYGVIVAETAGEHSKFRFAYCPNPNQVAQDILEAREKFEQENYRASGFGSAMPQYQPQFAPPAYPPQQNGGQNPQQPQ